MFVSAEMSKGPSFPEDEPETGITDMSSQERSAHARVEQPVDDAVSLGVSTSSSSSSRRRGLDENVYAKGSRDL